MRQATGPELLQLGSWGRAAPPVTKRRGLGSADHDIVSRFFTLQSRAATMFARASFCSACKRPVPMRLWRQPQSQYLHATPALELPRRKDFFSSNAHLSQKQSSKEDGAEILESQKQRRRAARSPATPTSLRRVAVEAQRSREGSASKAQLREQGIHQTKVRSRILV